MASPSRSAKSRSRATSVAVRLSISISCIEIVILRYVFALSGRESFREERIGRSSVSVWLFGRWVASALHLVCPCGCVYMWACVGALHLRSLASALSFLSQILLFLTHILTDPFVHRTQAQV